MVTGKKMSKSTGTNAFFILQLHLQQEPLDIGQVTALPVAAVVQVAFLVLALFLLQPIFSFSFNPSTSQP